jgi:pyruvate/2-oxoglutarate dehydrogenase complex dihydrolipoamide acyltransferase (E2) component
VPVVRGGADRAGEAHDGDAVVRPRVVDGALAGRLLGELKALIENPLALVV